MPNSHTKTLGYGLIAIGIVLVAVEASMMMRAGARNGIDAIDQYLFMALGAAVAIGVAVLPTAIDRLTRLRMWTAAAGASFVWVAFMAYSMMSTVSVSAISRAELMSDRMVHQTAYEDNRATVADLERRLKLKEEALNFLPESRTPEAIQGEINAQKQSKRWAATSQCTNATTSRSRTYCQGIARLEAEKADAGKRLELQAEVDNLANQLAEARKSSTGGAIASPVLAHADPEALIMASISTWDMKPGEKSIWSAEMSRYILVALLLLASAFVFLAGSNLAWPFKAIADGFPPSSGGHVFATHNIRIEQAEAPQASPYMATKPASEPSMADRLKAVAVDVAAELKRRAFYHRPTGPSAPMIEAAA